MSQQNQLKIPPSPHEIAPRLDCSQPPSSNLRGAKKRPARQHSGGLIATVANSKFRVSQKQQRPLHISNRNKKGLSEIVGPNSSPKLQAPLEGLIVSQKRLEIALTHSKQSLVAFSNRPKIHEASQRLRPPVHSTLPDKPLYTLMLEWGFFHE
jgi:hypothetical protein